jgi:uncharacterized protein YggE
MTSAVTHLFANKNNRMIMLIRNIKMVIQYISTATLLIALVFLSGCDMGQSQAFNAVELQTKASASKEVIASNYRVKAVFKAEGKTQKQATLFLTDRIKGFERWVENENFSMFSNGAQLSGMYQYSANNIRTLSAYEASVDFLFSELSFMQYQSVMASTPIYKPHELRLVNVSASDEEKALIKNELIVQAFSIAKDKADAMARAAELCGVRVSQMSESSHENDSPRMMRMEMASDSVHESESKKNMTVNLTINWLAEACDT